MRNGISMPALALLAVTPLVAALPLGNGSPVLAATISISGGSSGSGSGSISSSASTGAAQNGTIGSGGNSTQTGNQGAMGTSRLGSPSRS